jgi:hypothetical protein
VEPSNPSPHAVDADFSTAGSNPRADTLTSIVDQI